MRVPCTKCIKGLHKLLETSCTPSFEHKAEQPSTTRAVLERRTTVGGRGVPPLDPIPPPPPVDPDFIVGKNEITKENINLDFFWCTTFWIPDPPPPARLFSSNTSLSTILCNRHPLSQPSIPRRPPNSMHVSTRMR